MDKSFLANNKKILVFILLLICGVVMIGFGGDNTVNQAISSGIKVVTVPFVFAFNYMGEAIESVFNSLTEINQLKTQLAEAQSKLRHYEKQHKNIEEYKKLVEEELGTYIRMKVFAEDNPPYQLIDSKVVSWGIKSYFNSLIINKGSIHGIKKGMPVIAYQDSEKGVVGRVTETSLSFSKIRPLHISGSDIGAMLEKSRYIGIVRGKGNINELELNYLDKRAEITIGDRVLTLGEDSIFPKGMLIGYIEDTFPIETEFYKRAKVKPFVDFSKLHEVFIIDRVPDEEIKELKDE